MRANAATVLGMTFLASLLAGSRADDRRQVIDPEVQKCIDDLSSGKKCGGAITKLAQLGPRARAAAPALRKKLLDKNETIRANAMIALGCLKDRELIPEMIRMLRHDPSELIKISAIEAAACFGYGAKEVVPAIIELMGATYYAEAAFRAFRLMGPQVCDDLQKAWEDSKTQPSIRRNAIRALLFFTSAKLRQTSGISASLLKMLDDKTVAADAAEALTKFDVPRSQPTIALLERNTRDGPIEVRVHAAILLFELDSRNPHVIPALKCALDSETTPAHAAEYLAKMLRADSAEAADVLVENLASPKERVRIECRSALKDLERAFERVLPRLEKLANDKNFVDHEEIARLIIHYKERFAK
jgi:HEAT repeat protein